MSFLASSSVLIRLEKMSKGMQRVKKLDTGSMNEVYFGNEFRLGRLASEWYQALSAITKLQKTCTETENGYYEFDLEKECNQLLFRHILKNFEYVNDLDFRQVSVQESGTSKKGATLHRYKELEKNQIRLVINLRQTELKDRVKGSGTYSAVRLNLSSGLSSWQTTTKSYAIILHPKISDISIYSGENVPAKDKRVSLARSLYVVIDCVCKNQDITLDIVTGMIRARPINEEQMTKAMKSLGGELFGKKQEPSTASATQDKVSSADGDNSTQQADEQSITNNDLALQAFNEALEGETTQASDETPVKKKPPVSKAIAMSEAYKQEQDKALELQKKAD